MLEIIGVVIVSAIAMTLVLCEASYVEWRLKKFEKETFDDVIKLIYEITKSKKSLESRCSCDSKLYSSRKTNGKRKTEI